MTDSEATDQHIVSVLRDLGRRVHAGEVDGAQRAAALEHLYAALELLSDGEPRRRWYEVAVDQRDETRALNRELSAYSGSLNSIAPPMRIRTDRLPDGRPALIGEVRLDRLREGPPHSAHGGVLAGLFDELLGGGQRLDGGPPGMTGRLTVRYRRPTPLDADLELRAWIHDERRRRVVVRGECVVVDDPAAAADTVTAEAEAIFLRVDFPRLADMMRRRAAGETPDAAPPPEPR
jgi:acyl-coenzyme A thioesterase PaaI-like protein